MTEVKCAECGALLVPWRSYQFPEVSWCQPCGSVSYKMTGDWFAALS